MQWSKEELALLKRHQKKSPKELLKVFQKNGYDRNYNSVQKALRRANNERQEKAQEEKKRDLEKSEALKKYVSVLKCLGHRPSMTELAEAGIPRHYIRHRWGNLKRLEQAAREQYKNLFNEVNISDIYTKENRARLHDVIQAGSKFVITTAVTGCKVDTNFLASLDHYCQLNNAELLIMIASDPAHQWTSDDELGHVDRVLEDRHIVVDEMTLNDNLYLSCIKLSAKQIDPITGMERLAQQDGSYIFASPKQRMKFVPVPMTKHPPAIMGTGAITLPEYTTDMYMSRRTGYLAHRSHVMGAIVVEIEDNELFHFRQIQADAKGKFVDWGIQYSANKAAPITIEALVCGDIHAGREKPEVQQARARLSKELKPKRIVLHDLFDGQSISHHTMNKTITRAQQANRGIHDLQTELHAVADALDYYCSLTDMVIVVKSNHDEHLDRYLEDGRFVRDPVNYRISLDLAAWLYDEINPIQTAVEGRASIFHDKVTWLERDEDYIVAGVDLGHHGDRGPNGQRGSVRSFANSTRASITGHSHTAEIHGSAYRVGTSTGHLDYVSGPSSWTNTDCLLYRNGSRQLVNYIQGRCKPTNE